MSPTRRFGDILCLLRFLFLLWLPSVFCETFYFCSVSANIKIIKIKINCLKFKNEKISMEMDIYSEKDMLHHMATISICNGGHFESKMVAKIQKSSDLTNIWFPSRLWCCKLIAFVWEPCYDPSDHIISCYYYYYYSYYYSTFRTILSVTFLGDALVKLYETL